MYTFDRISAQKRTIAHTSFFLATVLLILGGGFAFGQERFRASVAVTNITPSSPQTLIGYAPRKSTGVRDSIYHKVVMLDDGRKPFYLVSSDLAAIAPPTYEKAAKRLKKMFNIDKEQFWWTNTHTHSAPEVGTGGTIPLFLGERYKENFDVAYANFVEDQLVEAVALARKKLVPARLGAGWGFSRANVNRRARGVDNKTFLGENPDAAIDNKIGLIRIESETGKPIALIANYPIHGTVLSSTELRISGDVPGVVAQYVQEKTGAPLLFINGALGNVAPRFSVSISNGPNKESQLNQFKKLLGEPILTANARITATTDVVRLNTSSITVETPRRADIKGWPEDMKAYSRTSSAGVNLVRMPVHFLQINDDIMIWGAPCELFCEVSNEVRASSPFPYTFYSGITNGTLGYLCTHEEIEMGGYEPGVSPFGPDAAKDVSDNVRDHLDEVSKVPASKQK